MPGTWKMIDIGGEDFDTMCVRIAKVLSAEVDERCRQNGIEPGVELLPEEFIFGVILGCAASHYTEKTQD